MLKRMLLATSLMLAAATANAATLTIVDQNLPGSIPPDDQGQTLGTLTFTGGTLVALNGGVAVDTSSADLATVTTLFNTTAGLSLSGGVQTTTFPATTDATYIALKVGEDVAFFQNTGGTALSLLWSPVDGAGAGFSTAYLFGGTVSQVPIPGALWLFGTGLAGLGLLSRSRKSKAASA